MSFMYIHQRDNWTNFIWDEKAISPLIEKVSRAQGRLLGRLTNIGFETQLEAMADNLTRDVVTSSEIEGINLNFDDVRSSIARRLGIKNIKETSPTHYVDSVVAIIMEAMEHYDQTLTKEKLCAWQAAFFPLGYSEGSSIEIGTYRTNEELIVSGYLGRERIHYIAPSPDRVESEMQRFLDWFNGPVEYSELIRSAIAHFWFVSIHPFEDGNGRLSRILADMLIARSDQSRMRFYNITSEINRHKSHYYKLLERLQKGNGDITEWLIWYLELLYDSIINAESSLNSVLAKAIFWQRAQGISLSTRQIDIVNRFLDGYESKITSKTWAQLAKCSPDTAIRDIQDLTEKGLLSVDIPGAKRPSYSIRYLSIDDERLSEIAKTFVIEGTTLKGEINGCAYCFLVSELDADRFSRGDVPMTSLLQKYCTHLLWNL